MDALPKEFADPEWVSALAPGVVRRDGWALREAGAVADGAWNPPVLEGLVADGSRVLVVSVNLKSKTFVRATCECDRAVGGRLCCHAMALLYAFGAVPDSGPVAVEKGHGSQQPSAAKADKTQKRRPDRVVASEGERSPGDPVAGPMVEGTRHFLSIELPSRGHPAYSEIRVFLERTGFVLEPSNRRWWLRGEGKVAQFLETEGAVLWEQDWGTRFADRFQEAFGPIIDARLSVDVDPDAGAVVGRWTAPGLEEPEVGALARSGRTLVRRGSGWVRFDRGERARAEALRSGLGAEPDGAGGFRIRPTRARICGTLEVLEVLSPQTQAPREWRERFGCLRNPETIEFPPIRSEISAILRPYQRVGVAWLYHLAKAGLGGILADEMGLGKTIQALVAVEAILGRAREGGGAGLIVCPAALVQNWAREAGRFVPGLTVRIHHGPGRGETVLPDAGIDLVVTTYETLARDAGRFREIEWRVVVADEAQQVRNRKTRRARALAGLKVDTRFVLTGTPIENSIEDLFSLFSFLLPGLFGVGVRSVAESGLDPDAILGATRPYILRRRKREVASDLPERIEMEIPCSFPAKQAVLYETIRGKLEDAIAGAKAGDAAARMRIFAELTRLRQICAEPRVIDGSLGREDSAKAIVLREVIEEVRAAGSRVLIFSQFTRILRTVESDLAEDGVETLYLDGSTKDRQALCDRFNRETRWTAFLISIQAGGTGLNLTGADTVILLDPWWNPAVEAQAIDRAHRIGQERTVTAIRLLTPGTVEERVRALQREKGALLERLFAEGAGDRNLLESLETLLRG